MAELSLHSDPAQPDLLFPTVWDPVEEERTTQLRGWPSTQAMDQGLWHWVIHYMLFCPQEDRLPGGGDRSAASLWLWHCAVTPAREGHQGALPGMGAGEGGGDGCRAEGMWPRRQRVSEPRGWSRTEVPVPEERKQPSEKALSCHFPQRDGVCSATLGSPGHLQLCASVSQPA